MTSRDGEIWDELETDDVGQKRYLMNVIMEDLLEEVYDINSTEYPDPSDRVEKLQEIEGYFYKLLQDYLTSSSTLEKQEKLEKMKDFVQRKTD